MMEIGPLALRLAIILVALKLLVWWLEPRMAFYPIRGVQETPSSTGTHFIDARIDTADGQVLHAWWLEHPNPRAQVIFWHGNGGNLSLWLDVIVELRRHGFSVLAVDFRGYGDSTGTASERGLYRDAEASVRHFHDKLRREGTRMIYWGRSIGCPVAAHAASIMAPDALVLETPMPDVRSILRNNPILWALSFLASYRFPTSRLLQRYTGPLLVVHGDADRIVPFSAGRRVFENARSTPKEFVVLPGADHNDLHLVNPAVYWREIDRFIDALPGR
jgi:alpha-beta hydrolase superfamily lysophospholipase